MSRIAGTATITVDGLSYEIQGDFEYSSAIVERENLAGMSTNSAGYKEKPIPCFIAFTGFDFGNVPLTTFVGMTQVTVVASLANGKVLTGQNMFTTQAIMANSVDATIKLRFEGPKVYESLV